MLNYSEDAISEHGRKTAVREMHAPEAEGDSAACRTGQGGAACQQVSAGTRMCESHISFEMRVDLIKGIQWIKEA